MFYFSLIMELTSIRNIERKEWSIDNGVVIPYYYEEEHKNLLEGIVPHDDISMNFPFDTAIRGILLPFVVLCANKEYGGLSQEGYNILGKYIKEKTNAGLFILSSSLEPFTRASKEHLPFLIVTSFENNTVYFPSGYYIIGNKIK